jgi:hypothetical protein
MEPGTPDPDDGAAGTPDPDDGAAGTPDPEMGVAATAPADAPEPVRTIADGALRRLDPRVVPLQRAGGWIAWAFFSFPLFAGAAGATLIEQRGRWFRLALWGTAGAISLLLAWLAHFWPPIAHRHAAYRVDPAGIEIRDGVVWRRIVNVARSRVQHTDVGQGPLERRFGLATLRIYTAGTEHAQTELSGIDHATALRIRDHLLPGRSDDAV